MKTSLDPSASRFGAAYLVALLVIAGLDSLWLGWLAKDFYRREMGELMAESIRLASAVVFYLLYPGPAGAGAGTGTGSIHAGGRACAQCRSRPGCLRRL